MADKPDFPFNAANRGTLPIGQGFLTEDWLYEENARASRIGFWVQGMLHEEQSDFQLIRVYDSAFFGRILTLDDLVMLTERDEFVYHEMLTHLPLCSMPEPEAVLIIGGGDCGCLREALKHGCVKRVVQCDIDPKVTEVCRKFFPWVAEAERDPRAEVLFADGVAYIEQHQRSFDLVIIDSTDPKGDATGLFSRAFYRKAAAALKPGGVLVAQTESPHWNATVVGTIYGELRDAFRHVEAYVGMIPTYPSGMWTWAYASADRKPHDFLDHARAIALEPRCSYYNRDIAHGAFALPAFVKRAVLGNNIFLTRDEQHLALARKSGKL